jgi:site-specific DNA-methyltransferase (adenine-specific)
MKTNVLYFGDNLPILRNRDYFPDECVDLIYLDPPFNSKKDYNVLFKETSGLESEAQIKAFGDTWHWTEMVEKTYYDIIQNGPGKISGLIDALHTSLGQNDMMAYLVMMTARLVELHRVLKPTGSLYLHCDPAASHYLKIVLDQIFGPGNFQNEIVWKRFNFHADAKRFGRVTERIIFYTKSPNYTFRRTNTSFNDKYINTKFNHFDPDGRQFSLDNLNPFGGRGPIYEFHGVTKPWRYTQEKMFQLEAEGRIYTDSRVPRLKRYLDKLPGQAIHDLWADISAINSQATERLGYPTQKPQELLERIISASSNEGDIVLDPFCGCGTAVVAAQKLNRKWIGIDVTHLAINLMRNRLHDSFGIKPEVIGEPADVEGARALANEKPDGRYQFQYWATGLIGAHPVGEKKKGADSGIDGVISFIDDKSSNKARRVIVQVKSGHVGVTTIRELKTVAAKEAIGVLIALDSPTEPMTSEALEAGYYHSPIWNKDYRKIQIITIEELLHGKTVDMPPQTQTSVTFAKALKINKKQGEQLPMAREKEENEDYKGKGYRYKIEGAGGNRPSFSGRRKAVSRRRRL